MARRVVPLCGGLLAWLYLATLVPSTLLPSTLSPASLLADNPPRNPPLPETSPPETPLQQDTQPQQFSAPSPPDLLDWRLRRQVFWRHLFGPQAVLETVPGTAFATARNFPRPWGRGWAGVTKRLGSQYGQFVVGEGSNWA